MVFMALVPITSALIKTGTLKYDELVNSKLRLHKLRYHYNYVFHMRVLYISQIFSILF